MKNISYFFGLAASSLLGAAIFGFTGLQEVNAGTTPLADQPLLVSQVSPNVMLALSVEFPTAIQYAHQGSFSGSSTTPYLGYFDPNKCYKYQSGSGYFKPQGPTGSNRTCGGSAWSGHFLNWATMQGIDTFRWALTGGNRSTDLPLTFAGASSSTPVGLTILQRAYASQQGGEATNFPEKQLSSKADITNYTDTTDHGFTTASKLYIRNWGLDYRFHLSTTNGNSCSPLVAANCKEYYVRAEVCRDATGSDGKSLLIGENCLKYTDSSGTKVVYKPYGLMQQYKDKMYFGAFGYLMFDQPNMKDGNGVANKDKDGGVLRAELQSVNSEISETGAFVVDPYGLSNAAAGITGSGTFNYLNKFGTTSRAYKYWDPVSELYAEIIKYFKAMTPTPTYVSGVTNASRDGFPVFSTWQDPAKDAMFASKGALWCKQNYIVGIGDTNTQYDSNLSGRASFPAGVDSDMAGKTAKDWTDIVGTLEGNSSSLGTDKPASPNGNGNSYLMAGIAYYAHSSDIRSDLDGIQNVTTFWMDVLESGYYNKNQFWLATKYGGYVKPNKNDQPAPYSAGTDKWNTQGRKFGSYDLPDNYYPASTPDTMVSGLRSAFKQIASISGAGSGVALSNAQINASTGGALTFQGTYDTSNWSGNVLASTVTGLDSNGQPVTSALWDAASKLDATVKSGWSTTRKVVTLAPSSASNASPKVSELLGKPFLFGNLSTAQKLTLSQTSVNPSGDDVDGQKVLNYLRGDRTYESTSTVANLYRERASVLGDIVNSKITYLGKPNGQFSDSFNPGYSAFVNGSTRQPMIFVGANDGMLHAFDASNSSSGGSEIFALVPYSLYAGPDGSPETSGIQALARTSYTHHYYVDATPEIRDVDFARAGGTLEGDASKSDWRSLLVVGLGKGGRSFVAMDVTNISSSLTESQIANKVLWEFSHPDMGFSFGRPLIAKTKKWGWVVILTGGYNNTGGDPAAGYNPGQGVIFVVHPKDGSLLQTIYTGTGTASLPAGLAQIEGYTQSYQDYTLDYVYGGDLSGNMWRFDFTDGSKSVPAPTKIAQFTDPGGTPQPITVAPKIEYSAEDLKRYVFVGTGIMLAPADQLNSQQHTMYALRDGTKSRAYGSGANQTALPTGINFPVGRDSMSKVSSLLAGAPSSESTPMGWYYDHTGVINGVTERVVLNLQANDGVLTWVGSLMNDDPCSPGGTARLYSVGYGTGQTVFYSLVSGLQSPVAWLDVSPGLADTTLIRVKNQIKILGTNVSGGSSIYGNTVSAQGDPRVVNWRIIRE